MTKHLFFIALVAACTAEVGGEATAPQDDTSDPWPDLDRQEREGPPRYTSRVHSCPKIRYRTLGNVLESRGVNMTATGSGAAGEIYASGGPTLGAPNYQQRVREHVELGLAAESKIFDIFAQAAPEIIANIANEPGCSGAPLFDAQGKCQLRGISCLIGVPATQTHVDLCNLTVARAADVEHGKQLAVAVLAAAAHTCE